MKFYPITFEVENGEIVSPSFPFALRRLIARVKQIGKGKYEIVVRRKKRSNPQNAYYWGVVVKMVKDAMIGLGNNVSSDNVHEYLKMKFEVVRKDICLELTSSLDHAVIYSTKNLSTQEFEEYLESIKQWSAEYLDLYIPDPNEAKEKGII